MNLDGFNADEIEPAKAYEPLPAGKYKVVISASEEKQTKSGNGSYLQLELTVIDGEHEGRKVFDRLNLNNPNQQAAGIARASLSAICRAVGVKTPQHSSELHDIPLVAKVVVRPAKDGYDASNDVKAYESCIEATPATVPSGKAKPAATKPADAAPPWQRKK